MPAAAWIPLVATVVSLQFTLALVRRWWRSRRPFLLDWSIALAAFTVGIAGLWYGAAFGFTPDTVRVYYVAGALLAAPWLGMGEVALLAPRQLTDRIRRGLAVASVVGCMVLLFAPLSGYAVTHTPPSGSVFPGLAVAFVAVSNSVGTLAAVGGAALSSWRGWRGDAAARSRAVGVLAIGLGMLLAAFAGTAARLGAPQWQPAVLSLAVVVMFAGFQITVSRVGRHRAVPAPPPPVVSARRSRTVSTRAAESA